MRNIKIIGVGGISTCLLPPLCRLLNFEEEGVRQRVVLVDGDEFKPENAKRQAFKSLGNKASVKARELAREFSEISFRAVPEFVGPDNIVDIVEEGDIVFMCVDNHPTRKLVSDHCETLNDCVLVSGGNELVDGNVQVHVRRNGENVTDPITKFHPEIQNPKGRSPAEMSCEERALEKSSLQIIPTNMNAAAIMLARFWLVI